MARSILSLLLPLAPTLPLPAADPPERTPSVAPGDEFLRHVPKRFATLTTLDVARRRVTLRIDGEPEPTAWDLAPDAEIKVGGWWGRLEQFAPGERAWAWFHIDRQKKPTTIAMLADGPSEQDIHGRSQPLPPDQLAAKRAAQQDWLRRHWLDHGLPGTVTVLHPFAGEMEVHLDHEAMRWARALPANAAVTIRTDPPVKATVRAVTPWRERTQLRLVVIGTEQAALTLGQRVRVTVPPPPAAVESSPYPPDLDRPRTRAERIDWFLASIYCTCGVKKDTCTGHFYTLASCNVNGCGMPNATRTKLEAQIDAGKTDRQIHDELVKERGPLLTKPHLLP